MRKCAIFVVLILVTMMFWTAGCTNKAQSGADSLSADSVDTAKVDSLDALLESQARIKFPLLNINNGDTGYIKKENWQIEHFFMRQGYYTLILDSRKQLNLTKDTNINNVTVEKIFLRKNYVKQYNFNRIRGEWMLTSINSHAMQKNSNSSFLQFYQRFATDSAFQYKSLNETIDFSGPDPDDDFSELEGEIFPEQWDVLGPTDLPSGTIYNIIYGQKYVQNNYKVFLLRGIANGQELEMTFQRKGGAWKLIRLVE